jgi:hypothetical protein
VRQRSFYHEGQACPDWERMILAFFESRKWQAPLTFRFPPACMEFRA